MNIERLLLLGQLKEAIQSKAPNIENRCRGLINSLVALETEQTDKEEAKTEYERLPISPERE